MVYSMLAICLLLLMTQVMWFLLLKWMHRDHREQRIAWERERERLLNRAMTKEWASYVQMTGLSNQPGPTPLEPPYQGMSDEEELRRAGEAAAQSAGLGETFVDFSDDDELIRGLGGEV